MIHESKIHVWIIIIDQNNTIQISNVQLPIQRTRQVSEPNEFHRLFDSPHRLYFYMSISLSMHDYSGPLERYTQEPLKSF